MSVLSDITLREMCDRPVVTLSHTENNVWWTTTALLNIHQIRAAMGNAYTGLDDDVCIDHYIQKYNQDADPRDRAEHSIEGDLTTVWQPMIRPFVGQQVREHDGQKILSYGTSSYGYDVRLDRNFKIFSNTKNALLDPLNPTDDCYVDHKGDYCIIPPNSYILGHTVEKFNIPRDIMVIAVGKSTLARLGGIVNVTPIEPGFKGSVVIEIANCTTLPLKVYANQGIAQFIFFRGDLPCDVSYADKQGKYQHQTGLTTARL